MLLPPPIIYIIFILLGFILSYFWPVTVLPRGLGNIVGIVVIVLSILIMPFVLIRFKRNETTFDVRKSATTLITDGPYKYSRNPTYVSLTLLHLGVGIFFNSFWVLLLAMPTVLVINFWIIRKEERYLQEKFGDAYEIYKDRVRKWI